jgi:hypothetical protein
MKRFQFLGRALRIRPDSFAKRRDNERRHRLAHDPLLVFNMSIFNFAGGWNRALSPIKLSNR